MLIVIQPVKNIQLSKKTQLLQHILKTQTFDPMLGSQNHSQASDTIFSKNLIFWLDQQR
jgi:hypothetical protein